MAVGRGKKVSDTGTHVVDKQPGDSLTFCGTYSSRGICPVLQLRSPLFTFFSRRWGMRGRPGRTFESTMALWYCISRWAFFRHEYELLNLLDCIVAGENRRLWALGDINKGNNSSSIVHNSWPGPNIVYLFEIRSFGVNKRTT